MPEQGCKSCHEDLPRGSLVLYCRECYDELTGGIISHEPAKLYSSGIVRNAERYVGVYSGEHSRESI